MMFATRLVVFAFALTALSFPAQARTDLEPPGAPGLLPTALYATREPNIFTHNVGLLTLQVTNLGWFGNPLIDDLSAGWRDAEYLYLSGLWIGAVGADQEPHVSTMAPFELRPEMLPYWNIYRSCEGAPGGNRYLGGDADDDRDGYVDEDFLDGLDNDGDGYVDEDFAAAGTQMFSCIYKDDTPEAIVQVPGHVPLNVLVRQRSYQWATPGDNEFVGVEFDVLNHGEQLLQDLYLGLYCDSDIGMRSSPEFFSDDLVGWDRLDTTLVYPGPGGPCSRRLRHDAGFMWDAAGDVPGVFGMVLLDHTTDITGIRAPVDVGVSSIRWFEGQSGYPADDAERYQTLASGEKPGHADQPGDYRYVMGVGPFDRLDPGESVHLTMAYVIGEGFAGFRRNAARAGQVYQGTYVDGDRNPDTGTDGKERCLRALEPGEEIFWVDPCDSMSTRIIRRRDPTCLWVDADCDPCTGTEGHETQLPWIGRLTPPSPNTNLPYNRPPHTRPGDSTWGDGRVTLQWDNFPECVQMREPEGEVPFEGYRIWKVHPGGSPRPGSPDWVQVAEFRRHPYTEATDLQHVTDESVMPTGTTSGGLPIYPVGRYRFTDSTDVINCQTYFYAVTAFGHGNDGNGSRGGLPSSPSAYTVVPGDSCAVPVRLLSFSAERAGQNAVLRWTVADEAEVAGFHVHRREAGGERIRITEALLTGERAYAFLDTQPPPGSTEYWLEAVSRTGTGSWHGPVFLPPATGSGELVVGIAVPNPFRSETRISYTLPDARHVRASVFDLRGRLVRMLADAMEGPGGYTVSWGGETEAGGKAVAGIYLLRLTMGDEIVTRRVLLLPRG